MPNVTSASNLTRCRRPYSLSSKLHPWFVLLMSTAPLPTKSLQRKPRNNPSHPRAGQPWPAPIAPVSPHTNSEETHAGTIDLNPVQRMVNHQRSKSPVVGFLNGLQIGIQLAYGYNAQAGRHAGFALAIRLNYISGALLICPHLAAAPRFAGVVPAKKRSSSCASVWPQPKPMLTALTSLPSCTNSPSYHPASHY